MPVPSTKAVLVIIATVITRRSMAGVEAGEVDEARRLVEGLPERPGELGGPRGQRHPAPLPDQDVVAEDAADPDERMARPRLREAHPGCGLRHRPFVEQRQQGRQEVEVDGGEPGQFRAGSRCSSWRSPSASSRATPPVWK